MTNNFDNLIPILPYLYITVRLVVAYFSAFKSFFKKQPLDSLIILGFLILYTLFILSGTYTIQNWLGHYLTPMQNALLPIVTFELGYRVTKGYITKKFDALKNNKGNFILGVFAYPSAGVILYLLTALVIIFVID